MRQDEKVLRLLDGFILALLIVGEINIKWPQVVFLTLKQTLIVSLGTDD
jgi:hypothetical protein